MQQYVTQEVKLISWGKGKIVIKGEVLQLIITTIHFKRDGAKDDTPSLCFEMETKPDVPKVVTQLSLKTLEVALNTFGYQITPIQEKNKENE